MVRSAAALAGTLEGEGMGGRVRVVVGKRAYTAASVIVAPRRHGNVAHARREGSMTRAYDSCAMVAGLDLSALTFSRP